MSMEFPHGRTVYLLRAGLMTDPYSGKQVRGDRDNPAEVPIPGAFIAQTSTSLLSNATREQAAESKSLHTDYLDVQKGDLVRDGEQGAPIYSIPGIPPAPDTNPFTGWTPPREIPLTRTVG